MAFRVLRLVEYVFDDVEQADENMKHWAVPANGVKEFRTGNPVRSMVIQYPFKNWDDVLKPGDRCRECGATPEEDTIHQPGAPGYHPWR